MLPSPWQGSAGRQFSRSAINDLSRALAAQLQTSAITIGFSGIDGSGKSTQVRLLRDAFQRARLPVTATRPNLPATSTVFLLSRSLTGDPYAYHPLIPATLRHFTAACSVVADHFATQARRIERRQILLLDRTKFCFASYAEADEADMTWIQRAFDLLPAPDFTVLLDVPVSVAVDRLRRRKAKRIRTEEAPERLDKVRRSYLARAASARAIVVDAQLPKDAVFELTCARLINELQRRASR